MAQVVSVVSEGHGSNLTRARRFVMVMLTDLLGQMGISHHNAQKPDETCK